MGVPPPAPAEIAPTPFVSNDGTVFGTKGNYTLTAQDTTLQSHIVTTQTTVDGLQAAFQDPHTTYETLTNPINNQAVQTFLRNPVLNQYTLGLPGDAAAFNTVSTKYASGDTPTDSDKTLAFQGVVKVGAIVATAGAAGYLSEAAGTAAAVGGDAEVGGAVEVTTQADVIGAGAYASPEIISSDVATGESTGLISTYADPAYTYATDTGLSDVATGESTGLVSTYADPAYTYATDPALAGDAGAFSSDAAVASGTSWSTYAGYGLVGGSVLSNLGKGNIAGAAGAIGAPGFISDLLPGAPGSGGGSGGGGTSIFPNSYQQAGSTQPQSSIGGISSPISTDTKAIIYIAVGIGLLFLLKKVKSHG